MTNRRSSRHSKTCCRGARRAIVLQPVNTGTAGSMVTSAHKSGVKVIGYDAMLVNGPLDAMVMQDSWAVGKLQAEAMVAWLKTKYGSVKGNVALIRGQPGDSNANTMSSGVLEVLKANPGLKLVADQSHEGWSPDKAMATTENLLTKSGNKIDAVICNNSGMARGVIAALDAQGLASADKIFVAGSDADLVNIQYVAQGKQAVEIWKKINPLAESAAEIAVTASDKPRQGREVPLQGRPDDQQRRGRCADPRDPGRAGRQEQSRPDDHRRRVLHPPAGLRKIEYATA